MQTRISLKTLGPFAVILFAYLAGAPTVLSQGGKGHDPPLIILAEMRNHKISYKVDGKEALPDLLRVLNVVGEKRGHDTKVIVLVDSRAPIAEIGNLEGTLGKAEFSKTRFFVFNKDANVMSMVEFGRTIPFSTHPTWD